MIEATFYTNEQDRIWSFEIHGHAGFAQNGDPDIVCAAVIGLITQYGQWAGAFFSRSFPV